MLFQSRMSRIQLYVQCVSLKVARRADFQRDAAYGKRVHQRRAANGGNAMADPLRVQYLNRLLNLLRPTGLAGVSDKMQTVLRGKLISLTKFRKR